jgi:hypothetical protein
MVADSALTASQQTLLVTSKDTYAEPGTATPIAATPQTQKVQTSGPVPVMPGHACSRRKHIVCSGSYTNPYPKVALEAEPSAQPTHHRIVTFLVTKHHVTHKSTPVSQPPHGSSSANQQSPSSPKQNPHHLCILLRSTQVHCSMHPSTLQRQQPRAPKVEACNPPAAGRHCNQRLAHPI